jgi:hypothetical protein
LFYQSRELRLFHCGDAFQQMEPSIAPLGIAVAVIAAAGISAPNVAG